MSRSHVTAAPLMGHTTRARLRDAITAYARQHPGASDTATGILGWWVPDEATEGAGLLLEGVLEELVADGVLRASTLPDGSVLYAAGGRGPDTGRD